MKKSRRRPSLRVEVLEDRCVPATWGNPWPDANHLTLSFAPDGTQVGNNTSSLFSTFNAIAPTQVWETTILRAFQTWADFAQINVGSVPDDGLPFGTPGAVQGDARFGDIRIAACNLGPTVASISTPFEIDAGTWSGDVEFNTYYNYGVNGQGTGYDLYTLALHEAGHVFGLNDNTDPTSAMYENYTVPRTGPSAGDVSNLLNLYAARTPSTNNQLATATPLSLSLGSNGSLSTEVDASINTLQDVNYFKFTSTQLGSFQVWLQTSSYSSLEASLTVENSAGHVIATASATNPASGDLGVTVGGLLPLTTYYIEVQSNSSDAFGIGGYHLQVETLPLVNLVTTTSVGVVHQIVSPLTNTVPLNTTPATAQLLGNVLSSQAGYFNYSARATITSPGQSEYFYVTAPAAPGDVMEVMVWGLGNSGLLPTVTVCNSSQSIVPSTLLVNDSGMVAVQIANPVAGAAYYLKVSAQRPSGPNNTGSYFVGVDITPQAVQLQNYGSGTLTAANSQQAYNWTINQTVVLHLTLSASTGNPGDSAAVCMTIYDSNGNVVFTWVATNGQDLSANVFLPAGNYLVCFDAGTPNGTPLPPLAFALSGEATTGPSGPRAVNPTSSPTGTPTSSQSGSTSGSSTSTGSTSTAGTSGTSSSSSNASAAASEEDELDSGPTIASSSTSGPTKGP